MNIFFKLKKNPKTCKLICDRHSLPTINYLNDVKRNWENLGLIKKNVRIELIKLDESKDQIYNLTKILIYYYRCINLLS